MLQTAVCALSDCQGPPTPPLKQTPVAVFCPFSLGKYAAVCLPQDKYESIPFLCLTTQRNLLLLQTPPKQTLFCTHRRTRHNYTYIFQILLKCKLLCFSLFFFVFPPAMKNSENLIHLVTHSGAHNIYQRSRFLAAIRSSKASPVFSKIPSVALPTLIWLLCSDEAPSFQVEPQMYEVT